MNSATQDIQLLLEESRDWAAKAAADPAAREYRQAFERLSQAVERLLQDSHQESNQVIARAVEEFTSHEGT